MQTKIVTLALLLCSSVAFAEAQPAVCSSADQKIKIITTSEVLSEGTIDASNSSFFLDGEPALLKGKPILVDHLAHTAIDVYDVELTPLVFNNSMERIGPVYDAVICVDYSYGKP